MGTTLIRNLDWTVAWDAASSSHVYKRGIDVAFDGASLVHVGPGFAGKSDKTIDGSRLMAMPGFVNIHSHPCHEPAYKGIREEHGVRNMYMSSLFERSQAFDTSDAGLRAASAEVAYCEMLRSGVTSVVDIGGAWEGWADMMDKSGLRSFLAPGFASSRWRLENDSDLQYAWDEAGGKKRFDEALALIAGLSRHPSGRLSGVVSPMQIDTCTADLLRDSHAAAKERGLPFTVHIAQGVSEVQVMIRRHGMTPVQWADSIGILGPNTILAHAIFIDSHSWVNWWTHKDLALIAERGCTVAHCPTPFARYGAMLESFGAYTRAGVNMGMGTDTTPHNMLEEIRKASTLARMAARDVHSVGLSDFLHAATVGGAKALMRDDLGRLAPGAKADLVLVDLGCTDMQPVRDPLRSLVFYAADRAVRDVYVDGRQVVSEGKVLTLDAPAAAARLAEAQQRMMDLVPKRDYLKRTADQVAPLSLRLD